MNPFIANSRTVLFSTLLWVLVGALLALYLVLAYANTWNQALFFALPSSIFFGFISASAYYVCRSLPMKKREFFLVCTVFGSTAFFSGLIWISLCYGWNQLALLITDGKLSIHLDQQQIISFWIVGSLLYLLSTLAYDVLIAFDNIRLAERREAASELLAREAELQVLRTQINPHFLFNSLNSISALTTIDPAGARSMTIELAQFFRMTLALSEKQRITVAEEIALCTHFLSVEKIRFGSKLQVEMEIDPTSNDSLLPPMLLQPLLENAIKHGIRDLVEGGTITITSKINAPWLYLAIANPIDLHPSQAQGTGTGLKNLQARIISIYGERSRVNWQNTDQVFRIEIAIPMEKESSN